MSTNIQICDGNNAVFLVINEQIKQPKNDFVPKSRRFIEQKVNKFLKKVTSAEHEFWNDQSFCPNHADIPQTPKTLEPNEHNNVKKVKKREPKIIVHSEFWDYSKFLPATNCVPVETSTLGLHFAQIFISLAFKLERVVHLRQKTRFWRKSVHFPDFAKKCPILVKICHFRLRVHRHTGAAEVHNSTWKDCLAPKLCTQASHGPQQSLQLPVKVLKNGTPKKGSFWLCAKCVSLNVDMWDLKMLPKYSSCSKENFDYFQIFKSFLIPHQRFYGFARTPSLLKWIDS